MGDVAKFWTKVQKSEGCWLWTGTVWKRYGKFYFQEKTWRAHRLSYFLEFGEIPEKHDVHHKCGNQLCVRPSHLELITTSDHSRLGYKKRASKYVGITPDGRRWRAQIRIDGRSVNLGRRDTEEEAYELRQKALRELKEKEGSDG
jgi:HNH endonuclease